MLCLNTNNVSNLQCAVLSGFFSEFVKICRFYSHDIRTSTDLTFTSYNQYIYDRVNLCSDIDISYVQYVCIVHTYMKWVNNVKRRGASLSAIYYTMYRHSYIRTTTQCIHTIGALFCTLLMCTKYLRVV